jgi:hypothetical protein
MVSGHDDDSFKPPFSHYFLRASRTSLASTQSLCRLPISHDTFPSWDNRYEINTFGSGHKESLKAKPKPLLARSIKLLFLFLFLGVFQKNNLKQNHKHAATPSLKLILHDSLRGRKNG